MPYQRTTLPAGDRIESPDVQTPARRFTIRVRGGTPFACAGDERVLEAMRQSAGRPIAVGCRRGGCGVCRVRVIDGAYSTAPMSGAHVTPEDRARGIVLSCCIYPESDLTLEVAPRPKPAVDVLLLLAAKPVPAAGRGGQKAPRPTL